MNFEPLILEQVQAGIENRLSDGELLPPDELQRCYSLFRNEFALSELEKLDGEELLVRMHGTGNRDGLMYSLEFRNDDELPLGRFGGIGGGSALKFGFYRKKETGEWTTGSPQKQRTITTDEAIAFARMQRQQLSAGAKAIAELPDHAQPQDYQTLQGNMEKAAPDLVNSAWAHKYFSLIFPEKIDDIHSYHHQRYHMIKLLKQPPDTEAKYQIAYVFVELARQLKVPINWSTAGLYQRSGFPHPYWRIGTTGGSESSQHSYWDMMKSENCIAVGWDRMGDFSYLSDLPNPKEQLKQALEKKSPNTKAIIGREAREICDFVLTMKQGDLVVAMQGMTVLGIGRIKGDYFHATGEEFPNRRPVEWLSLDEWKEPGKEGLRQTVRELRKPETLLAIERRLVGAQPIQPSKKPASTSKSPAGFQIPRLEGISGRIQSVLERKSQVILYGPPGTGKTFWAERATCDLAAYQLFGRPYSELSEQERLTITNGGNGQAARVRMCCFHPAYGYEDFLEGYRPHQANGQMVFELREGIFRRLCRDAERHPDSRFYLIIDEINRGDIPRIFGELLTVREKNKRGKPILLPMTGEVMDIPSNVFVIATMNTADRSIALLDTALRRRFGFIELMPDTTILRDAVVEQIPIGLWLESLNQRICSHIGRDARNLQIGHSYLMEKQNPITNFSRFAQVIQDDIIPLLEEYCYEDYEVLHQILGDGLVDHKKQRIRHELFTPDRKDDLLAALKLLDPQIMSSTQAVKAEDESDDETAEEELDDSDMDEEIE